MAKNRTVLILLVYISATVSIIIGISWVLCCNHSVHGRMHFVRALTDEDETGLDVHFRIIVVTFNRAASLVKTLNSLDELLLDGDRAVIEIWIDVDHRGRLDRVTERVARSFRWRKGTTYVHVQPRSVGIYGQWIDTWRPRPGSREIGLIVEDDVDVSPMAYRWLKAVHREMANRTDFAGASLTSGRQRVTLSPMSMRPLAVPKTDTVFMYKCLGTWGFSPSPERWRLFQNWFHLHKPSAVPGFQLVVPDSLPRKWYAKHVKNGTARSMWAMWFIYYMNVEQLYVVYNNLDVFTGNVNSCLSIHRAEIGLHYKVKRGADDCMLTVWKNEFVTFPKDVIRLHWDGTPMGSRYYFL